MLDDLDRVEWSSLSHPLLGTADGVVPGRLRGLLDSRHVVRTECFQRLYDYLLGSDQLAEAAVLSVPFLMEIVESESDGRGFAALLLCGMARAGRMSQDIAMRDALEQHRDEIVAWSGGMLVDARAFLLSCLDRFTTPEDRPERKVLRALWRVLSEETEE